MASKRVVICDICKEIFDHHENGRTKVKFRDENYVNYDDWEWAKWEKVDLCPKCSTMLINLIKGMTRGDIE